MVFTSSFRSFVAGAIATSLVLQSSALPTRQQASLASAEDKSHSTLLGQRVNHVDFTGRTDERYYFVPTKRGTSGVAFARRSTKEVHIHEHDHDDHHSSEDVHIHKHVHRSPHDHDHWHDHEDVNIHEHEHRHRSEDHDHDHDHDHNHGHDHDHDHDHDKRDHTPFRTVFVHSTQGKPALSLNIFDSSVHSLHVRGSSPGLLDGVLGLLSPLDPLLEALVPILNGLPIVGGVMNIVDGVAGSLGGSALGSLLSGKPLSAAFVVPGSSQGLGPQAAYQVAASTSDNTSPMYLAKLPFSFNSTANCSSSTPPSGVPVSIAMPVINNSSLQIVCATYSTPAPVSVPANGTLPSPPAMLMAQPCWNSTNGSAPAGMSQVFAFDESTGVVQPVDAMDFLQAGPSSCPTPSLPVPAPTNASLPVPAPVPTAAAMNATNNMPTPSETVVLIFTANPNLSLASMPSPPSPPVAAPSLPVGAPNGTVPNLPAGPANITAVVNSTASSLPSSFAATFENGDDASDEDGFDADDNSD